MEAQGFMSLSSQIYLVAGLGSLALALVVVFGNPFRAHAGASTFSHFHDAPETDRRTSTMVFAGICLSLAFWNIAVAVSMARTAGPWSLHRVFLLGSSVAAPLTLWFIATIVGLEKRRLKPLLSSASIIAGAFYLFSWNHYETNPLWNEIGVIALGSILFVSLWMLFRSIMRSRPGPRRKALVHLFGGGLIAVSGGLLDFLDFEFLDAAAITPVAILVFLVIACAWVVRYRFFDVDIFLARGLALMLVGFIVALCVYWIASRTSFAFLPMVMVISMVTAVALSPIGQRFAARAQRLFHEDQLAKEIQQLSQDMARISDADELWAAITSRIETLRDVVEMTIVYRARSEGSFHMVLSSADTRLSDRMGDFESCVERFDGIVTPESLREAEDTSELIAWFRSEQISMIIPLSDEKGVRGGIIVVECWNEGKLSSEAAAAFAAIGSQAVACLDRIAAIRRAGEKEALARVGEMSAGLAHEIRNPAAAIRGAAQVLAEDSTEGVVGEMLEVIEEESARLGRVIGEFLEYARPSNSDFEKVDLAALLRRVVEHAALAGWDFEIRTVMPDVGSGDSSIFVFGNADQLRRVFDNLIRNAFEATGSGGQLEIRAIHKAEDGEIVLRFEDNGPGISPDMVSRIFTPFVTTKSGGTGLGLALAQRIMEAHGGEIRVEQKLWGSGLRALLADE